MNNLTDTLGKFVDRIFNGFLHSTFGPLGDLFEIIAESFKGSIDFFITVFKALPSFCLDVSSMLPPPLNYLLISFIGFLVLVVVLRLVSLVLDALPVV